MKPNKKTLARINSEIELMWAKYERAESYLPFLYEEGTKCACGHSWGNHVFTEGDLSDPECQGNFWAENHKDAIFFASGNRCFVPGCSCRHFSDAS